jgi:hypothetical protein
MGGGTQVSTSTTEPWEQQIPYLTSGFKAAKDLFNKGIPEYYPGETLAGFDPAQTAANKAILGYAMGPRPAAQQAGAERQLLDTYGLAKNLGRMGGAAAQRGLQLQGPLSQGQYSGLTPYSHRQYNDLLAGNVKVGAGTPFGTRQYSDLLAGNVRTGAGTPYGAMENALTQGVIGNLQKNVLPGIRQQQVMYQPGGSSMGANQQNKAVTEATVAGLTKPLAQMYGNAYQTAQGMRMPAAQMYGDAYQTAQGLRMPAAQMGLGAQQFGMNYGLEGQRLAQGAGQLGLGAVDRYPGVMNAPLGMYGAMGKVGAQRRAMTQAAMDRDMARYEYQANAPQTALRNYMAMVTGDYGSTGTQTTPGPSGLDQMGQVAGIVGTLAKAGLFGSDERLKDNITHIGIDRGYNIYSWDWNKKALELGIDTPTYGVMAQEVLETNPDAVELMDNGYYAVNYGEL